MGTWEEAVAWLRAQPDKGDLVRAAYMDDPLQSAAARFSASAEWQATRALIGEPGKALDVGAGNGIASYALARDGFSVTALEPDPSALVGANAIRALAESETLPIAVVEEISERLPFPDASFDLVYARAVLHHIADLGQACREFARILRPGGRFVAVREHVISKPADLARFHDIHPLHHRYGGESAFSVAYYRHAIEGARFRLQRVIAPLRSPINLDPFTQADVIDELKSRVSRLPGAAPLIGGLAEIPPIREAMLALAERFDHRPGRHYSFVAVRP